MKVEVLIVKFTVTQLLEEIEKHLISIRKDFEQKNGTLYDRGWEAALLWVKGEVTEGHRVVMEIPQ